MLEARRRLRLRVSLDEWVSQALLAPGVRLADLTPEIAIESTRLPGQLHNDPADRILIATARRVGARLVTRDTRILEYGGHGHVSVLDATP